MLADFVPTYDNSAGTHKKVKLKNVTGYSIVASGTVSAAATLDIVLTSYTGCNAIDVNFNDFIPATDGVGLYLRTSTDGGSTFDSAASAYRFGSIMARPLPAAGPRATTAQPKSAFRPRRRWATERPKAFPARCA